MTYQTKSLKQFKATYRPEPTSTPRVISNSGGRTSGLMTLLEMAKGLGPEDYVIFCNTGKEREETLQFLHLQQTVLGVPIIWLEYCQYNRWKQVTYETASRKGEPFSALIQRRKFLPHQQARFCTQELKIRVMRDFMRSQGHGHWINVVGIRADEPTRHASGKQSTDTRFDVVHPLYEAGIKKPDVLAYWRTQPFDLQLQDHEGNCDLCFLKGKGKLVNLIRTNPESADWWIDSELTMNAQFSKRQSYSDLRDKAISQMSIDFYPVEDEESINCHCTD